MNSIKLNYYDLFVKYKSSYKLAFLDLSQFFIYISLTFYLIYFKKNSIFSIFTILFLGLLNMKCFIIFHDCGHDSFTPSKLLNIIIGIITGILTLTPLSWKFRHDTHHATNGNIENNHHYFFNETIILTKKQFLSKTKTS